MNGDIQFLDGQQVLNGGSKRYLVLAGATLINPGEPVVKLALGTAWAGAAQNSTPVVGTDELVGISVGGPGVGNGDSTFSSQTSSANGTVDVWPIRPNAVYLIVPNSPTTYFGAGGSQNPSQTTYNTFVGARVTFNLSTGTYTINSTDSANNGLVVEYVDVTKYPGKVAFSIRNGVNYLA